MDRLWGVLQRRQLSVKSAAIVLMVMVFVSRLLGLARDRLLSSRFSPEELGVYFAAFRLPNLIFELLVMGALTAAFIPVFTKFIVRGQEKEAHRLASVLINISILVTVILILPLLIWAEAFSAWLAPGFSDSQIVQMADFTRFMLFFQVVPLLAGNFFTGVLQSYSLFLVPALAPVVYNLGIITGIYLLSPFWGLWSPVLGVGLGAIFFMLIQLPLLAKIGYRHTLVFDPKVEGLKEITRLLGPRTFGLAVSQIDTTVDLILASLLGAKMVTVFNFAQHLQQLPVGLFGTTVAQAALPSLSRESNSEELIQFKRTIVKAVSQILFFILPTSAMFIVLRIPLVRLVFGASRFDWEATVLTGMTLSAFSLSLFAQAIIQVLTRGFYALYDSKTPVIIGAISITINIVLSIVLTQVFHWQIWALGISTSLASITNVVGLFVLLDRRVKQFSRRELFIPGVKMVFGAFIAAVAVYIPLKLFDQLVFDTTRVLGLLLLTGVSGAIGLSTYLFICWVLGVGEVSSYINLLSKFRLTKSTILEPASEVVNGGMESKMP